MTTAKELKEKYDADLKEIQDNCTHPEISDWMPYYWAPAHYSHDVKQCLICWKVVQTLGLQEQHISDDDTDN